MYLATVRGGAGGARGARRGVGWWASSWAPRSRAQVRAIYAELGEQVRAGLLTAPVERVYPIDEIRAAVAHAGRGERGGKILVAPNEPIAG